MTKFDFEYTLAAGCLDELHNLLLAGAQVTRTGIATHVGTPGKTSKVVLGAGIRFYGWCQELGEAIQYLGGEPDFDDAWPSDQDYDLIFESLQSASKGALPMRFEDERLVIGESFMLTRSSLHLP